ncbi:MAG: hypothetical protein WDO19_03810 [Bacteroidota bacterium]
MKKENKPAEADKTILEKIGDTISNVKDVIVEKKDELVEVVQEK